jgi:type II secretory pathway component PulK
MNGRERGAALILAMLVAALAATVAVALASEQQRWFADVSNRRDQVQAQSLALAGIQVGATDPE